MGHKTTAQDLRAELMAPEPIKRVHALHALELELGEAPAPVARELEDFTARGIPFYAPHDPHYCEWVGKAVHYWEQLHRPQAAQAPRRAASRGKARQS